MPKEGLPYCVMISSLPLHHHPLNSDIQYPLPLNVPLVTRLDEVICQLLDRCCCVPGYHTVFVVSNENSHLGLDNDNAFSALYCPKVSQNTL
jgi:hypothetical protein